MSSFALLLCTGTALAAAGQPANLAGSRPNVLVLFADDLGVGDLGVLGHPTISSPNIDKIALAGVRFTAWYSGFHICSPSRAAMLTGRLCIRSGTCGAKYTGGVFSNKPVGGLPTNETTFATALKTVGYKTLAMGKWHLGTKAQFMPTGHGFDEYFGIPFSVDMGRSAWSPSGEFPPLPLLDGNTVIDQPVNLDTLSTRYAQRAGSFIKNASASVEPWLLYLAFQHVHTPDFASPKFCGVSRRGLFGDVVAELDWLVGEVLGAVESAGVSDKTIVWFTSDNGPWTSHALNGGSAGPFRDGKGSVWEGGVREPGLVYWPGTISPRIESEPVATYDIFPTILKLAGVPLPSDRDFDGRDIMPLLLETDKTSPHDCIFYWKGCTDSSYCGVPDESPLVNNQNPGLWAVRCGSYKTHFMATNVSCSVQYMAPGIYQDRPLIYRIDVDPSERFPIVAPAQEDEYQTQLAIATAAVKSHVDSLKPVVNQIALGSDPKITQDGGAALCGCPDKPVVDNMKCMCEPENMRAFVCVDTLGTHLQARSQWPWLEPDREEKSTASVPDNEAELTAAALAPDAGSEETKTSAAANVVVFFVDDSGYADYGVYGAPSTDTPNVDKMAAEGARFTQWYTAHAICTPSRAAMMTGRLPIRFGLASSKSGGQGVFGCSATKGIPANETTMAELLKAKGFRTHMVGKWHLGSTPEFLPVEHGFDSYFGIPYSVDMGFAFGNRTEGSWSEGNFYGCTPLPLLENNTVIEQPANLATINERYTESALGFIWSSLKDKAPFFLYLAFGHVHTPQYANADQAGKSKRGIFGDSVAEVDHTIGAVLSAIKGTNTIAFLSSDNGAPDAHQHLQAGQIINAVTGSNFGFLGSKTQTWEGGIREPGIVWWPEVIQPQIVQEVASTLDVFASVADAVGIAMPSGVLSDSISLLPLVAPTTLWPSISTLDAVAAVPFRNASFFYAGTTLMAVRVGPWKAHLVTTMPFEAHAGPERGFLPNAHSDHPPYGPQKPWLLFNVEHDPSEMYPTPHSVGAKNTTAILEELTAVVAAHRAQLGTPPPGVLSDNCDISAPATDCRLCCDHAKKCACSAPPGLELGARSYEIDALEQVA